MSRRFNRTRFRPVAESMEDRAVPATFVVTTFDDSVAADPTTGIDASGQVSLRSALQAANNDPTTADTVVLAAGTYSLTIPDAGAETGGLQGDLNVNAGSVTIQGSGSATTKVQAAFAGGAINRLLHVQTQGGATARTVVNITGVTLTGGQVNQANTGFDGGGIQNQGGAVALTDVVVTGNTVTISGGGNAVGGGIMNNAGGGFTGFLTLTDSVVSNNTAKGIDFSANGQGAGIYNASGSTVYLLRTKVIANTAAGADFTPPSTSNPTGSGAGAGLGGGLFNESSGTVTITDSHFLGNVAIGGASQSATDNVFGSRGQGAGAYLDFGSVTTIVGSTFSANTAQGGTSKYTGPDLPPPATDPVAEGGRADGGGLYVRDTLTVRNSTFSGNKTVGGTASGSFNSNNPGPTNGGGLYFEAVTSGNTQVITNSTITLNEGNTGGGIASVLTPGPTVQSTIVAGNVGQFNPDVNGNFVSLGNNLIGDTQGSTSFDPANNDLVGNFSGSPVLDPQLAPLGNYGGPTPTHALLTGSPAIDNGSIPAGVTLATDQRGAGFPRIVGAAADIGAVEFKAPVAAADAYPATPGTLNAGVTFGVTAANGVLANDTDPTGAAGLVAVLASNPSNGTLELFPDGSFNYTPQAGFSGADTFTYRAKDAAGNLSDPTTVTLQVTSIPPPTAAADTYAVTGGTTLTISPAGVLTNDTDPNGAGLTAVVVAPPTNGSLSLNPNGGFTYTPLAGFSGTDTFTYQARDARGQLSPAATVSIQVDAVSPPPVSPPPISPPPVSPPPVSPPPVSPPPTTVPPTTVPPTTVPPTTVPPTTAAAGGRAVVVSGQANGTAQTFNIDSAGNLTPAGDPFTPFEGFTGVVRSATGDLNGDGVADFVYVTGPGGGSLIRAVDGRTGADLAPVTTAFEASFTGGLFAAVADFNGDGKAEIVVSPDQGGGGRITVFAVGGGAMTASTNFLGIDDANFRGGARVAVADINNDGTPDVVVGAGFGGGPRVAIFDGRTLTQAGGPSRLTPDFFAFPGSDAVNLRNGVFVAAGDFTGDGRADLAFGGGPGGAPRVFVLDGSLVGTGQVETAQATPVANFFAFPSTQTGGVRLAAKNFDGDQFADLVAGSGDSASRVLVFAGKTLRGGNPPGVAFDPFDAADGVFVG